MKILVLLSPLFLFVACSESEPERDPVLDKVDTLPVIDALEINERANLRLNFDNLDEAIRYTEKRKAQTDIRDLDDKLVVMRGTIKHITSDASPVFSIALHGADGATVACQMKTSQEYYREQLKVGQKVRIVGQFDLGSELNGLYYSKMYDGVLVQ